jgi:hypothetical protein
MSDCDEDVEKALATLEHLSARELEVTGEKLARRRDGLRAFGLVFADVARTRRGGSVDNARFQLVKRRLPASTSASPNRSKMPRRPSGRMCARRWPSGIRNPRRPQAPRARATARADRPVRLEVGGRDCSAGSGSMSPASHRSRASVTRGVIRPPFRFPRRRRCPRSCPRSDFRRPDGAPRLPLWPEKHLIPCR